ncbi:hypothetical protein JCM33374_g2898 [Metschnikowia sp. JCM 33374]|nr:hypothetical protein JCM33374_g2898 [Metschnikowia sp. JCM 33374]
MVEETPESLIYSAIEGFETQPDVASIGRINESGSRIYELWKEEEKRLANTVAVLEAELRTVTGEIDQLKTPTSDVIEQLHLSDEERTKIIAQGDGGSEKNDVFSLIHEQTMLLDGQKIALAKQLSEIETTITQMQAAEMQMVREEAELIEQKRMALAATATSNLSSTTMKIMLFKKFGIHIEEPASEGNDKIVIFNEHSDAAKVLDVDPKFSDYFISNYIWEQIGTTDGP